MPSSEFFTNASASTGPRVRLPRFANTCWNSEPTIPSPAQRLVRTALGPPLRIDEQVILEVLADATKLVARSTPAAWSSAPTPMPESMSKCGEPIAPPHTITSRASITCSLLPTRSLTPVQQSPSRTRLHASAFAMIVRLSRAARNRIEVVRRRADPHAAEERHLRKPHRLLCEPH